MIDLKFIFILALCLAVYFIFVEVVNNKNQIYDCSVRLVAIEKKLFGIQSNANIKIKQPQCVNKIGQNNDVISDSEQDYQIKKTDEVTEYSNNPPNALLSTVTENESSIESVIIPNTESVDDNNRASSESSDKKASSESSDKKTSSESSDKKTSSESLDKKASSESLDKKASSESSDKKASSESSDKKASSESSDKKICFDEIEIKKLKFNELKELAIKNKIVLTKKINGTNKLKNKNELCNELLKLS